MNRIFYASALVAFSLAGCSGGDDQSSKKPAEERASTLQPGEYELVAKVDSLRSTDATAPASKLKEGASATTRTCVGEQNRVDPAAFVEAGESCTPGDTYMSGGRMSLQFRCNRAGKGALSIVVDGKFKKDSFEAEVITATLFSGSGDYELRRSMTAKRVGECSAKAT
jgi:hypothetical protein